MKSLAVEITRYEVTDRDGGVQSLPCSDGVEKFGGRSGDGDGDSTSLKDEVKVHGSVYASEDLGVAV